MAGLQQNQIPSSPPTWDMTMTTEDGTDPMKSTLENMANLLKSLTRTLQNHSQPETFGSVNKLYDLKTKSLSTESIEQWFGKNFTTMDDRQKEEQWTRLMDQQTSPMRKSSSQSKPESERFKKWKIESVSVHPLDAKECNGMTIEHIRTKGALYGPAAVSAVGGITPRTKRSNVDRPVMKKARSFGVNVKTVKPKPVMTPPPSPAASTPWSSAFLWESNKTSTVSPRSRESTCNDSFVIGKPEVQAKCTGRQRTKSADDITHDSKSKIQPILWGSTKTSTLSPRSSGTSFVIGKSEVKAKCSSGRQQKKSDHDITDESKSKIMPIGWQSNMNAVGNNNKDDSTLRYVFSVTSGRKSTFFEKSRSDTQFQKGRQTLEKQRVPTPTPNDIPVGEGKSSQEKVSNMPMDSFHKRGKAGSGKRRVKAKGDSTNKAKKTRKAKGNTEQKPLANETVSRLLGPKIAGINSEIEVYTSPHPSRENLLDPKPRIVIRTVVLPVPRPKYMPMVL